MTEINTGTITVDFKFRPRPRGGVMVAGRIRMGKLDTLIRPQDIELRTIKSMVVTPMIGSSSLIGSEQSYRNTLIQTWIGSIGVLDSSRAAGTPGGNYCRLRPSVSGSLGDTNKGTLVPGSFTASFLAFGE